MPPSSWSNSYLLRLPLGISMITVSSWSATGARLSDPGRVPHMRARALTAFLLGLAAALVLAAPAMAGNNGEGLAGETDDKLVTFFSLGVIVFFVLVVVFGTIVQSALERRKQEKKAAALRQRTGW